jgi:hypothetical protein
VEALLLFTPLENPAIPACRQTGMAGTIKIDNVHLRKVRVKAPSFLTGHAGGGLYRSFLCRFRVTQLIKAIIVQTTKTTM